MIVSLGMILILVVGGSAKETFLGDVEVAEDASEENLP